MVRALVVLLGMLVLAGPALADVDAALEWEPGRLLTAPANFLPFSAKGGLQKPPEGMTPPDGLGDPRLARIRWGDGWGLGLVLDLQPGRERLWVDADVDGAFDPPHAESVEWAGPGHAVTRELEVSVVYEDEETRVLVRFLRAAPWGATRVRVLPLVHRQGFVEIEGRLRLVALSDGNADLRFDDAEKDAIWVDLDGNGELDLRLEGGERVLSGKTFRLGDHGYRVDVPAASGKILRFRQVDEVPPARPRAWRRVAVPAAGYRPAPPSVSLQDILQRIEAEKHRGYTERRAAVVLLGRVGTDEAFRALDRLIREDPDLSIRAAAARAMGNASYLAFGGSRVVELTRHPTPGVAVGAVEALHRMDHPDREAVYRKLLASAPDAVVGVVARGLAYLGTPAACSCVRRAWLHAQTGQVRLSIYQGFRAAPEGPPLDVIQAAARDEYLPLRAAGLRDLAILDPDEALRMARASVPRMTKNLQLWQAVIDVLLARGEGEDIARLLDVAETWSAALVSHLSKHFVPLRSDGVIQALLEGLKSDAPAVRRLAAETLANSVQPSVTETLHRRVKKEKDEGVLAALLDALGDHGDPASVSLLLKMARSRKPHVRQAAIRALGRVGLAEARVQKALLRLLTSSEYEDRILAVDALAASGDRRLAKKLVPPLEDEAWQVRLAAVQASAALLAVALVEPLIRRLELEGEARIREAVARTLARITGQFLYDDPVIWRRWWKTVDPATFEVPTTPRPPTKPGDTGPAFFGIPLQTNRVIFVIDQSGSMGARDAKKTGATRLQAALHEVLQAVTRLGDRDRANIILFHSTVHPWQDRLKRLTKNNRRALGDYLKGKGPTGGTNLFDALETALYDDDADTVFLLSDGAPGVGRYTARDDILRAVRRINQTRRIRIHTIAVGMDSALLKELAKENDGQYLRR